MCRTWMRTGQLFDQITHLSIWKDEADALLEVMRNLWSNAGRNNFKHRLRPDTVGVVKQFVRTEVDELKALAR